MFILLFYYNHHNLTDRPCETFGYINSLFLFSLYVCVCQFLSNLLLQREGLHSQTSVNSHTLQLFSVLISDSGADPGFFVGGGFPRRNGVTDW